MDPSSKGDYSRHIREASMVVERLPEVNPPSGRVPGSGILVLPIFESRRRRNREVIRDAGFSPRASSTGVKIARRGTRGRAHLPGTLVARPGLGSRHLDAWEGV